MRLREFLTGKHMTTVSEAMNTFERETQQVCVAKKTTECLVAELFLSVDTGEEANRLANGKFICYRCA